MSWKLGYPRWKNCHTFLKCSLIFLFVYLHEWLLLSFFQVLKVTVLWLETVIVFNHQLDKPGVVLCAFSMQFPRYQNAFIFLHFKIIIRIPLARRLVFYEKSNSEATFIHPLAFFKWVFFEFLSSGIENYLFVSLFYFRIIHSETRLFNLRDIHFDFKC